MKVKYWEVEIVLLNEKRLVKEEGICVEMTISHFNCIEDSFKPRKKLSMWTTEVTTDLYSAFICLY